jgi:nucleoside-diphosphate-sugar epimerase
MVPRTLRERVLVTGATGFVGRLLPAALAAHSFDVHAVAHCTAPPPEAAPFATWHRADLLDAAEIAALIRGVRPSLLVHAAWYVVHGRFWIAPENESWLDASTELARRFAEAGGRRLVGLGSCAEYAVVAEGDGLPWPESRPVSPATPYGRAKASLGRRLARMSEDRAGFSVAWARLFHLFGPAEPAGRLVPSVVTALLEGREAPCGSGRPVRDFASTWFVADAIASLTASDVAGAVNVGSGMPRSIGSLSVQIATLLGRADLLRMGALPDRPGEVPFMVADTRRLRSDVGFTVAAATDEDLKRVIALLRRDLPAERQSPPIARS